MTLAEASASPSVEDLLEFEEPVLFLEFVNADQFPGRINAFYPLVSGYYRSRGVPVRWIRFGVSTLNLMQNDRDEITLTDDELARLLAIAEEHAPGLLIATDSLHAPQLEAVRERAPGARLLQTSQNLLGDTFHEARSRMQVVPGVRPFYGFEPGNAAAEQRRIDNIYLLSTEGCGHHLMVATNPRFAGVDTSRFGENLGCTFCTSSRSPLGAPKDESLRMRNLSAWTERQVEAIAEDRRANGRLPNGLLFERLPGPGVLEACLEGLRATGLDDEVQVLFAIRTNQIPAFEERMEAFFTAHPDSRLTFGVYASGIESFSPRDLELFNKGASALDGVRAVVTLRDLSHRHPGQFWYTGLSFLLFTPWTSLDTLHLNAGLISLLGVSRKEAGNVFQSRLRLHEALPLKVLAEKEELLIDEVSDPVLVMNRRKLFSEEHPWRYGDPRLEPVTQIVLRFDLLWEADGEDPMTGRIAAALQPLAGEGKITDDALLFPLLLALVETALAHPEVLELEPLLEGAVARHRAALAVAAAPPPADRFRIGHERLELRPFAERLRGLLQDGGPRVVLLEGLVAGDPLGAAKQDLVEAGLGVELLEAGGRMLFARDARDLAAFQEGDEATRAALRGIPTCCATAHRSGAEERRSAPGTVAWQVWADRLVHPGAIPEALLPAALPALAFPTCRPDCPEAARTWATWLERLEAGLPTAAGTAHLLGLGAEESFCSLTLLEVRGEELIYDPASLRGSDPALLARLGEGDRLRRAPAQLQILSGDRLLHCLTGSHALWEAGRPPPREEAEVWLELARGLALREAVGDTGAIYQPPFVVPDQAADLEAEEAHKVDPAPGPDASETRSSEGEGEVEHPTHARGLELLRQACASAAEPVGDLAVEDCWEEPRGLGLRVSAGDSVYTLLIVDGGEGGDHLLRTDRFLLQQPPSKDDALRGKEHRAWVGAALRSFDRLLADEASELVPGLRPEKP